jgi:hypothetical protein
MQSPDLVPMALTEAEGVQPTATAIVLNENHAQRHRFDQVFQHPAYQPVIAHDGLPIWMRRLNTDAAAQQCDAHVWRYHDVKDKAGPCTASAVQTWLRLMSTQFALTQTWFPVG